MSPRRWILLLTLGLAGFTPALAQDPVGTVEVQAQQARGSFHCDAGWEATEVRIQQAEGERERLRVPLLGRRNPGGLHGEPSLNATIDGIELLPGSVLWPGAWNELPRSLQSRTLPPVQRAGPRIGNFQWAWLAMTMILVLALRRRPWLSLLVGALSAGLLFGGIPAQPDSRSLTVTVLEGDGEGHWLQVRGARDQLRLDRIQTGWLGRLPANAETHLELPGAPDEGWLICADGARLFFSTVARVQRGPTPAGAGDYRFEQVWVRLPGEGWSARGPWTAASGALPPALESAPAPPGWLAAGLPQGRAILAGRLESSAGQSSWLRLIGFE